MCVCVCVEIMWMRFIVRIWFRNKCKQNYLGVQEIEKNMARNNKKYLYLEYILVITWVRILKYNTLLSILRIRKKMF